MSMISLLLHKAEAKLRPSVNNKDIIRMRWDITGFYPTKHVVSFIVECDKLVSLTSAHLSAIF